GRAITPACCSASTAMPTVSWTRKSGSACANRRGPRHSGDSGPGARYRCSITWSSRARPIPSSFPTRVRTNWPAASTGRRPAVRWFACSVRWPPPGWWSTCCCRGWPGPESLALLVDVLRQLYYPALRVDVVPAAPFLVPQDPEEAQAAAQPGGDGHQEAQQRLPQADGRAIGVLDAQAPDLHAQGLAVVGPELGEEAEQAHHQQGGEQRVAVQGAGV